MRKTIISAVLLAASLAGAKAQDKTLYYMTRVPQASFLNSSATPDFSTYVGFPGLSNVSAAYNNSSFALVDVLKKGTGLQRDSLVFDIDGLSKNIGKMNFIRVDNNIDLLSFGFRVNRFYGHFNISSKTSAGYSYPKGLVDLRYGNYDFKTNRPRTINLNDMAVNGFSYVELGLGLSQEVNEKLSVGGRFKVLSGLAAIRTSKLKANIVTSDDFQKSTLNVDAEMFVSAPNLTFGYDSEGKINDVSFDDNGANGSKDYKIGSNLGLGVDFGATYKMNDKLTFYGSLVDLGFIRWNSNGYKVVSKGNYDFSGADITPDENGDVDFDKAMEAIGDTLKSKFTPTDKKAKFTTLLKTKAYFGATYSALNWLNCGALLRGGFYGSYFDPAVTLSANATPFKALAFSLTYSIYNRSMNNFGAGIVVGGKPIQLYIVTDNILSRMVNLKGDDGSSLLVPGYTRSMNIQFGINLFFGWKGKKRVAEPITCDQP